MQIYSPLCWEQNVLKESSPQRNIIKAPQIKVSYVKFTLALSCQALILSCQHSALKDLHL